MPGELGNAPGINVFVGGESTYLRTEINNAANGFIREENIFDGDRAFSGATLSSNNYEVGIRAISILPSRGDKWANR